MKKQFPDQLKIIENTNDKGMRYKGWFYVAEFDFIPDPPYIERTTKEVAKLLDTNSMMPSKNLAVTLSKIVSVWVVRRMSLNHCNLKDRAMREVIELFLHSSVFNLRTAESIKNSIIIPTSCVLEWWDLLPKEVSEK